VNPALFKRLSIFSVPAIFLMAAFLAFPHLDDLSPAIAQLLPVIPFYILSAGMLLSIYFNRGRVFALYAMLLLACWASRLFLPQGGMALPALQVIFAALCLLLPVNIALFCYMREKGILSIVGKRRLLFLAGQAVLVVWLIKTGRTDFLHLPFSSVPGEHLLAVLSRFQRALLAGAFIYIVYSLIKRQSPIDGGFLAALAALVIVCDRITTPHLAELFFSAAGLALILSLVQDSYNMAFRDDLTNLPSRRALNEHLLGLARPYAIAMLDVDHFKRFNDTYGHDVGDQVLKMVGSKIGGVAGGGKPYRYGGEEFTVIFPKKTIDDVKPYLEELRKTIAEYRLCLRGSDRPKNQDEGKIRRGKSADQHVSVTISIGVAESSERLRSPGEVIKAADGALYKAKKMGRNQVCS